MPFAVLQNQHAIIENDNLLPWRELVGRTATQLAHTILNLTPEHRQDASIVTENIYIL